MIQYISVAATVTRHPDQKTIAVFLHYPISWWIPDHEVL
jgi:hypothetical protein